MWQLCHQQHRQHKNGGQKEGHWRRRRSSCASCGDSKLNKINRSSLSPCLVLSWSGQVRVGGGWPINVGTIWGSCCPGHHTNGYPWLLWRRRVERHQKRGQVFLWKFLGRRNLISINRDSGWRTRGTSVKRWECNKDWYLMQSVGYWKD